MRNTGPNTVTLLRTHQLWTNMSDQLFVATQAYLNRTMQTSFALTRALMCLMFLPYTNFMNNTHGAINNRFVNVVDWVIPFILALLDEGKTFRCRLRFERGVTRKNGQMCTLVIIPVIRVNADECITIRRIYHVTSDITYTVSDSEVRPLRQTSLLFSDAVRRAAGMLTVPDVNWWKTHDE